MTAENWGKEQAEKHWKETGHATMGSGDVWTCAECDGILLELIPVHKTQEGNKTV